MEIKDDEEHVRAEIKATFEAQDRRWLRMGELLNVIAAVHPRADQTREEAERDARNRLRAVAEENGTTVAGLNRYRRYADAVQSGDQAAARKARRRLSRG
jgi:LDH2 family malate/lactate/ureidoglycolate dehydrogenase